MCRVKVFQMKVKGHGQGHVIKIYGTIGKVLSKGTHFPNMRALSLKVKKLSANQKCDRQTDRRWTKWSLSGALLRWHKKQHMYGFATFVIPAQRVVRGYCITLLWFRACVCPSRFYLVNTIETLLLCAYSSDLADMFTMMRGWNILILEVKGQGHSWRIWK